MANSRNLTFALVLVVVLFAGSSLALKCFLCEVASASDSSNCPQTGASAKTW